MQKIIFKYGEREILKAAASTKAQNLPAKSLDEQIKTAKFYRTSRQCAIKSCGIYFDFSSEILSLDASQRLFLPYTKGHTPCKLSRP
ncbi:hypothetical protein [uncultured Campylobacter sp.]|uniref:hypothetical protein n=1 Tax=uncultured Campylobacter sp. TaxID=218934 RepID=UPI0028E6AA6B|nr:hypothetical protein [uncultured Campylobacter sp.]